MRAGFQQREGTVLAQLREQEEQYEAAVRRPSGGRRLQPAKRKAARHGIFFYFYILLVILSAAIVGGYAAWNLMVREPELPQPSAPEDPGGTVIQDQSQTDPDDPNALVRRDGVYNFVLLGKDVKGSNTDTIIVVSYDTVNQTVGMTSIPRDTAVNRSWSGNPKLNAAFYGSGPDTLKEEIQNTFGIPIDYYILVDTEGFVALINELGGVDVYIPENMDYDDPSPGEELHIHYTKGNRHLNGTQALEVVRFRHNTDGTGYTDTGRSAMQREVLTVLAKKVISWDSLTKVQSFVELFQTYVKTDLSATDMLYFAKQAMGIDLSADLTQNALPGRGDGVVNGVKWCYMFQAEDILPVLNELVNPYTRDLTADDLDLPEADRYLQTQ